jgi:hypothetical protein
VRRGKHSEIEWWVNKCKREKTWLKKKETTFPAAANVATRLALRRANVCMERDDVAEKEG